MDEDRPKKVPAAIMEASPLSEESRRNSAEEAKAISQSPNSYGLMQGPA